MHTLKAVDLKKKIKTLEIVKGMSLEVSSGEVVGLLGPNGAGKTTTFYMICGLVDASDGEVFFDGENIFHYDIYNHGLEHFLSLGMLEELDKKGIHFVEWGDDALVDLLNDAGISTTVIEIVKISQNEREYRVEYAHT